MFELLKKGLKSLSNKIGLTKPEDSKPSENLDSSQSLENQKVIEKPPKESFNKTISKPIIKTVNENEVLITKKESKKKFIKVEDKKIEPKLDLSEELKELENELEIEQPKLKDEIKEEPKLEKKVSIFTKIKSAFSEKYFLSEKEINIILEDFELSLLQSDVSLEVNEILISNLKDKIKRDGLAKNNQDEYLKQMFLDIIFENYPKSLDESFFKQSKKPFTILFVGTNGSGKTTNIAKLGYYLKSINKSCVFSASDTYRAAAIDQLEGHANILNIPIIKGKYGQDPASVAYDAVNFAKSKNYDFVLIDSSGRQDNSQNLMKELEKIKRVINPDYIVFVAEAISGQTALMQAESFNKYTNFDAFILSKVDVDEKGGTLLSISLGLKKPVLFLGVGQEYKDIAFFNKNFLDNVI